MANTSRDAVKPEDSLLFAEILELSQESKQSTCTIGAILADMSDIDRSGLQQALDTPAFTGTAITAILKRRGHQISSHTVQRHRRGGCGCIR